MDSYLFIRLGYEESGSMQGGFDSLISVLDRKAPVGLRWDSSLVEDSDHGNNDWRSTPSSLLGFWEFWRETHGPTQESLIPREDLMDIAQAQREMRSAFLGGFMGQFVAGILWGTAAALATWGDQRSSIAFLVLSGMFVLPLSLPLVGAAALHRMDWFFPAFMVVLGAHYVPFVFLYGMRMFAGLAGVLWTGGMVLGLWVEAPLATGGWLTAAVLLAFAFQGRRLILLEESAAED